MPTRSRRLYIIPCQLLYSYIMYTVATYIYISIMTAQDTFFGQHSFEHGIMISYRGEAFLFFSQLSILIADEVAIKQSVESKGAAGKLFCSRCSNVISKYSWDNAVDTTGLVHGACTDVSQFRLHTNESVQKVVKYLEEQHGKLTSVQFAQLETQLGYNWNLLASCATQLMAW